MHAAPAPGECHLWTIPVRPYPDWRAHLDTAELQRLDSLTLDAPRHTFLTSRAAQRLLGARYLGIPPAEVVISRDCGYCGSTSHGRPRFTGTPLDYSVSHAGDWVLVALSGRGTIGVDVEELAGGRDTERLAAITLTAAEQERFRQLPPSTRAVEFYRAWTRKEAVMKLTGLGLRAAPNQLNVSGPMLAAGPLPGWSPVPVYLSGLPAPAGYVAALACTTGVTAIRPQAGPLDYRPPRMRPAGGPGVAGMAAGRP